MHTKHEVLFTTKLHFLCTNLYHTFFALAGILLALFCATKADKIMFEDATDSGGILLKSNTEGRGEEVVRKATPVIILQ